MWKVCSGKLSDRDRYPTYALAVNEGYKALYMEGEYIDNNMAVWSINEEADYDYIMEHFSPTRNCFPSKLIGAIEKEDPDNADDIDTTTSVEYDVSPNVRLAFNMNEESDEDLDLDDMGDDQLYEEFGAMGVGGEGAAMPTTDGFGGVDPDTGEETPETRKPSNMGMNKRTPDPKGKTPSRKKKSKDMFSKTTK